MPWQATSAVARVARALGGRRDLRRASSLRRAVSLERRLREGAPDAVERARARALAALTEAPRARLEAALAEVEGTGRVAVERALAAGAPPAAARALAERWGSLDADARALVVDPVGAAADAGVEPGAPVAVRWGTCSVRQIDATTCGAATLAVAVAIGDPLVGLWLATGERAGRYLPPEALGAASRLGAGGRIAADVGKRWAALQREMHVRVTRSALGPLPWPRSLGSPPWRADDAVRFLGLDFRSVLADDTDRWEMSVLIQHAAAAVADGIPVPIYAGGDSSRGLEAAIPRHVMLAVRRLPGAFAVYEPGSAALHHVTDEQLLAGGQSLAALGNWTHVSWFVIPRQRQVRQ